MIPFRDKSPAELFPFTTLALIILNCLVLLYQFALGPGYEGFVYRRGLIPYEITHDRQVVFIQRHLVRDESTGGLQVMAEVGEKSFPDRRSAITGAYLPVVTSTFLHANLLHLAGNMIFLWLFANKIENYLGHLRFLWFYLLCGIIASFSHVVANVNSQVPTIGASGAVSGVLGAYLLLYPNDRILEPLPFFYFMRIGAVPAFFLIGMWFVVQLIYSLGGGSAAWFAHIGGFIGGLLLVLALRPRKGLRTNPRSAY